MTDNDAEIAGKNAKELAAKWLFSQGTSTVLLFCILLGLGYSVVYVIPQHMQLIQAGYDRNARDLKEATTPIANSVDKLAERVDRLIDREYRREPGK